MLFLPPTAELEMELLCLLSGRPAPLRLVARDLGLARCGEVRALMDGLNRLGVRFGFERKVEDKIWIDPRTRLKAAALAEDYWQTTYPEDTWSRPV